MIHGLVVMNPDHFAVKGGDPAGFFRDFSLMETDKGPFVQKGDATISPYAPGHSWRTTIIRSHARYRENTTPEEEILRIPDTQFEEIQHQWK